MKNHFPPAISHVHSHVQRYDETGHCRNTVSCVKGCIYSVLIQLRWNWRERVNYGHFVFQLFVNVLTVSTLPSPVPIYSIWVCVCRWACWFVRPIV